LNNHALQVVEVVDEHDVVCVAKHVLFSDMLTIALEQTCFAGGGGG
jgi:hypothetical protein